ncbi:DUF3034 family protein [Idiomarina ramblicola]|uniref:DUF3034 domain-containing protein n=1 Tax=Idiomarina ramblicola TaxID=263724 RepID=A0A432YZ43_9GAMM|nr:DUF3034 family protein [Idiomarina ramblicola]RUO68884.1 DUF3034 domain-containing protein [Idiomarina ramblicola]
MRKRLLFGNSTLLACALCFTPLTFADQGARLLATGGASTLEGSGGGGIVPWATLSSYAGEDQFGATINLSEVSVDDFRLSVQGASLSWSNRIEVSYAEQTFDLSTIGGELSQSILGAKVRVAGDLIYGDLPQISVGLQHKENNDYALPSAVGSQDDSSVDWYVSAAKAWLDGPFHRTWVANLTVRSSKANQLGLLGFGGDKENDRDWLAEASVAAFINRYWAVGVEYRQKPDNLSFAEEQDWKDVFVAYFPNKHVSVVGAYTDLGSIAGLDDQTGWYLSVQAAF